MNLISDVLAARPHGKVHTLPPEATVADATRFMAQHGIGCVVVSETGSDARGVLCERLIVRKIAEFGLVCLIEEVARVMHRNPPSCRPSCKVATVLERMVAEQLRYMPVIERGRLVGIVSLADLAAAQMQPGHAPFHLAYA